MSDPTVRIAFRLRAILPNLSACFDARPVYRSVGS